MPMASGATGLFGLNTITGGSQYSDYLASITGLSIDMAQSHAFMGTKFRLGGQKISRSYKANMDYRKVKAAEFVGSFSSVFAKDVDFRN